MATEKVLGIAGTGMLLGGDMTLAAKGWIEASDAVFYHVADAATAAWLEELNPTAQPLVLDRSVQRDLAYQKMCQPVLDALAQLDVVTAVFYGHPVVLTDPALILESLASGQNIPVKLLPGVSSVDSLMCDLKMDLFKEGCSIYEATDFLRRPPPLDPQRHLVLLQVAMIDNRGRFDAKVSSTGLIRLHDSLLQTYPKNHRIAYYTAAYNISQSAQVEWEPLEQMSEKILPEYASLYIPPVLGAQN